MKVPRIAIKLSKLRDCEANIHKTTIHKNQRKYIKYYLFEILDLQLTQVSFRSILASS